MRKLAFWVIVLALLNCNSAQADWRDENPNQPNGYAASTFRYHHGTPGGDDGPANGYRASSFRSSHGLEGYMPPEESSGRWGAESGRWGGERNNNDSLAGSMLRRNFRKGQAEGAAMRYQSRQNNRSNPNQMGNAQYRGYGREAYNRNPNTSALRSRLNARYNQNGMNMLSNYRSAQNYYTYNAGRSNPAMTRAINQRPLGRLIQNSRGGFNRIYTEGY